MGIKSLVSLFLLLFDSRKSKSKDLFRSESYEIKKDNKYYFHVATIGDKMYFYNLGKLFRYVEIKREEKETKEKAETNATRGLLYRPGWAFR